MATLADLNAGVFVTEAIPECIDASSIVEARFIRVGRVCHLRGMCKRTSQCGSGGNISIGTLGTVAIKYAPTGPAVMGNGYYGALALGVSVQADGTFTLRNCSPSTLAANASFTFTVTWIYEGALPPT